MAMRLNHEDTWSLEEDKYHQLYDPITPVNLSSVEAFQVSSIPAIRIPSQSQTESAREKCL